MNLKEASLSIFTVTVSAIIIIATQALNTLINVSLYDYGLQYSDAWHSTYTILHIAILTSAIFAIILTLSRHLKLKQKPTLEKLSKELDDKEFTSLKILTEEKPAKQSEKTLESQPMVVPPQTPQTEKQPIPLNLTFICDNGECAFKNDAYNENMCLNPDVGEDEPQVCPYLKAVRQIVQPQEIQVPNLPVDYQEDVI